MSESEVVATEFVVPDTGKIKYMCELCKITFCLKKNLNYHLKAYHQLQIVINCSQTCVLCDQVFTRVALLHDHLQNVHSVPLNFIEETFYLEKDFLDWKNKIEKESQSMYILRDTKKKTDCGITLAYYKCHRSGNFDMKKNRVRKLKALGSIKSGSNCPAGIKVFTQTVDGISEIKVRWQSVHLGHDMETCVRRLTKEERENLAACLKLGISMDKILELAKQNPSPYNPYRLLTRKHLHNIRRDFKISLNSNKPEKAKARKTSRQPASGSSNSCEDGVETEANNHEEIKESEKESAVSSLLLQQTNIFSEQFSMNKVHNILNDFGIQLNSKEPQKTSALPTSNVEASDSSNSYMDCVEIEDINHEGTQEHEKNSSTSSLVLQQNRDLSTNIEKNPKTSDIPTSNIESNDSKNGNEDCVIIESNNKEIKEPENNSAVSSPPSKENDDFSEQFNMRKKQIFKQIKGLRSRIDKWDPKCPLPNVEEHFKSINLWLDVSAEAYKAGDSNLVLARRNKQRKTKND